VPAIFSDGAVTAQAHGLFTDWLIFVAAGLAVALVVSALILFPVVRWHRRAGDALPPQFHENKRWSIVYISLPIAIVIALFVISDRIESRNDAVVAHPDNRVEVTAYRWEWRFAYPQTGRVVDGTLTHVPELVLPSGVTTQIDITANDVNHAFWVPAWGFKRDAIPGKINTFDITPLREGTYRGECGEFCGLDHALMAFTVRVVSPQAYRTWLATRRTAAL
jgi:cytochrome c oxidase subunit 2